MKTKKGILIDVVNQTITEVELDGSKTLKEMYRLIGCSMVEIVRIDPKNDLWVNEEGLLTMDKDTKVFRWNDSYLVGNGLVLGNDTKTGNSCDTTLTLEQVTNSVHFLDDKKTKEFLDFVGI